MMLILWTIALLSITAAAPYNIPDYLVVGQQKCGTSTLFNVLRNNSHVLAHKEKELLWWASDNTLTSCDRSVNEYLRFFDSYNKSGGKVLGEFSSTYFSCYCCPQLLKTLNPNLKIVILLREPVARSLSRYLEQKIRKTAPFHTRTEIFNTFDSYVDNDIVSIQDCLLQTKRLPSDNLELQNWSYQQCYGRSTVVGYSAYDIFLSHWLKYFPAEQLLVLYSADLMRNPLASLQTVENFLGVPNHHYAKEGVYARYNSLGCYGWHDQCNSSAAGFAAQTESLQNVTKLVSFLKPHMVRFKQLISNTPRFHAPDDFFKRFDR